MKIWVQNTGKDSWILRPHEDRTGNQLKQKGELRFNGTDEQLADLLKKLKAKDSITDPPSSKNLTYKQMVDEIKKGSDPYIWIWNNNWITSYKPYNIKGENMEKNKEIIKEIKKPIKIEDNILEKGDIVKIIKVNKNEK